jgi:UDP-N-acetylglucosamine 2-epimerase (non-hydrolysing)
LVLMKILHVVGARPNFMKVAPVISALSGYAGCTQILVHTGQHYDLNMSDVFFRQLSIPKPDYSLGIGSGTHAVQTAEIMMRFEPVVTDQRPDLVLVYGDVNSTAAAALVCAKLLIPLGHVEAGLRSHDRTMPEEINRLVTDRLADLLFTPSIDGNENLIREGTDPRCIHLAGNVMIDTLVRMLPLADGEPVVRELGLNGRRFVLVTLHRPSNVDNPRQLSEILQALNDIAREADIIFPVHPRTRRILGEFPDWKPAPGLHVTDPLGYMQFLGLQRMAALIITDSGGIQEESTYLRIPCLTVRENTERPVTVTVGSNTLVGRNMDRLKTEAARALSGQGKTGSIPALWDGAAGERIAAIACSFRPSE